MPPAKRQFADDSRPDNATGRDRSNATTTSHARGKKAAVSALPNGHITRDTGLTSINGTAAGAVATSSSTTTAAPSAGVFWNTAPADLLDAYRVSHELPVPAAFGTPLRQALLMNPGIGRQSPTMARRRDKRRIPKEQLALAVRKHFNAAAVNEVDVVVELLYKVHHQDKTFRMRSSLGVAKKPA